MEKEARDENAPAFFRRSGDDANQTGRLRDNAAFAPFACLAEKNTGQIPCEDWPVRCVVGMAGFELATPCTPCKCATWLRYTPKRTIISAKQIERLLKCLTH